MQPSSLPPALAALTAAAAVIVGGCGGGSKTSPIPAGAGSSAPVATAPATAPTATTAAPSGPLAHKPTVGKGQGPAPKSLVVHDIVAGTGPAVRAGQTLSVQYVGVLYRTGKQFDASWDRGAQPFSFPLGAGQVIPGWDKGLVGMHVGGRRELIIPASLAYGAQGQPPTIPPNSPLIFVVDLVSAQ